jgi:hypothetical protein
MLDIGALVLIFNKSFLTEGFISELTYLNSTFMVILILFLSLFWRGECKGNVVCNALRYINISQHIYNLSRAKKRT